MSIYSTTEAYAENCIWCKFYVMRVLPQFKKFDNKSAPPLLSDHRSSSDSSSCKPGGRLRDNPDAARGILASRKPAWDTCVLE